MFSQSIENSLSCTCDSKHNSTWIQKLFEVVETLQKKVILFVLGTKIKILSTKYSNYNLFEMSNLRQSEQISIFNLNNFVKTFSSNVCASSLDCLLRLKQRVYFYYKFFALG